MPAGRNPCETAGTSEQPAWGACHDVPKADGTACCRLKNQCDKPDDEPNFCDRPYCE